MHNLIAIFLLTILGILSPVALLLGNPVELADSIPVLTLSTPVLRSEFSPPVRHIQVGDQIVIATTATNNDPVYDWSSYVLVEVRNQDGITIMLGWQSGIIETGSQAEIGISWTPDQPGEYELRTFAISDFQNPMVMSDVRWSRVTVAEANNGTDGPCSGSASCFSGLVTKIVDGDTLDVDDTRVRLSLVDTPEIGETGYEEAIEFTSELCLVGSTVLVDQDDGQPTDDFGRMIAKVTCEGELVLNAELVDSGYAQILREFCDESEFSSESWIAHECNEDAPVIQKPPVQPPAEKEENCHPSYPDLCIPPPPPDLDCPDIPHKNFRVIGSDPHRFDGDNDGLGCES